MEDRNQGEGNYEAARQFQKEQHKFAQSGQADDKAREAAEALDGEEGEELERARRAAAEGETAADPGEGEGEA